MIAEINNFTDRKNQVTTFQYDALNRRIRATYADATTTFTYDTVGRLTKATDTAPGAGTIDFAYDILDRLIQETTPLGTVAYQYDVLGRRTQMTANGQQPTTYQYDAASRLTQVAQGNLFAALGYDNANRRTSLGYSNGTTTSYAYDLASRLTSITHNGPSGVIESLAYSYDAAGNRSTLFRANGTASLLPNAISSAAYDAANEQTSFAGTTLQYDANGNLTNDGVNTYQWDARNRLIGISGSTTASFAYDARWRRASKTVSNLPVQFLYDGKDIATEVISGTVGAYYLRSRNTDEPFSRQDGTGIDYFHTDALGSSLVMSNAQGVSVTTYAYEPFGKTAVTGSSTNSFQYTGRENDGTGLYYYRARYYRFGLQRFMGQDPARFGGGDMNLYSYAFNNPMRFRDPNGLLASPWHFFISYGAMRATGHCFGESVVAAWDDAMTDFRPSYKESQSAGNANQHAMATPRQSLAAAQAGIQSMIDQQLAGGNLGGALHINEDKYSRSHGPDKQWNGDFDGWSNFLRHQYDDWFPSWNDINSAAQSDMDIIQQADAMNGRKPGSNNTCSP